MISKSKQKIKLGDYVQDSITGYEGICIGIITYLNGCARIGIQSKERHRDTGLPVDSYWVDETTVSVKRKQVEKTQQNETGGPNSSSSRYGIPSNKPF